MKKKLLITITLVAAFVLGFAFNSLITKKKDKPPLRKVTGLGGIFFKCKDPKKMREWYKNNHGLNTNTYGTVFEWHQGGDSTKKGFTQWSPFSEKTTYFEPSTKEFMIKLQGSRSGRVSCSAQERQCNNNR